jgi:hypothetical protein
VDGSFLRLSEGYEIAIYLRDGVPYLAEFQGGRGELHTVGAWFSLHHRGTALRRVGVEPAPIPPVVAVRIERLHREAATSNPSTARRHSCLLSAFRS